MFRRWWYKIGRRIVKTLWPYWLREHDECVYKGTCKYFMPVGRGTSPQVR